MAVQSKIKVELNLFSLVGQKVNNAECSCITVQLHANNHIGLDDERKQTRCGSAIILLPPVLHLSRPPLATGLVLRVGFPLL